MDAVLLGLLWKTLPLGSTGHTVWKEKGTNDGTYSKSKYMEVAAGKGKFETPLDYMVSPKARLQ